MAGSSLLVTARVVNARIRISGMMARSRGDAERQISIKPLNA
jgi:hypothetical protein